MDDWKRTEDELPIEGVLVQVHSPGGEYLDGVGFLHHAGIATIADFPDQEVEQCGWRDASRVWRAPPTHWRYLDFAYPPPPALEPCALCASKAKPAEDYVVCPNTECNVIGPFADPDGAKWDQMQCWIRRGRAAPRGTGLLSR